MPHCHESTDSAHVWQDVQAADSLCVLSCRYTTDSGTLPLVLDAFEADIDDGSLPAGLGGYVVTEAEA